MMAACTQTKNNPFLEEWNAPYGIPPFEKIQLTDYIPAVKAGIEEQNKELEAILNNQEAPTFENTVAAYELAGKTLTKTTAVLFNLQETEGSDEMNKVVEEATALMTEHEDNISMNKAFFERVKAVYDADQSGLTREQQMVLKKLYQRQYRTRRSSLKNSSPATVWIWRRPPRQGLRRSTRRSPPRSRSSARTFWPRTTRSRSNSDSLSHPTPPR